MINNATHQAQQIFQENLRAVRAPQQPQVNSNTANLTTEQELITAPRETHPNTDIVALRQENNALREQLKILKRENATLTEQLNRKENLVKQYENVTSSFNQLNKFQAEALGKAEEKNKKLENKNKELENKNKEINKLVIFSKYFFATAESILSKSAYILNSYNIPTLSNKKLLNLVFLSYLYIDTLHSPKNNYVVGPRERNSVPRIVSSILEIISLKIKNNEYTMLDKILTNLFKLITASNLALNMSQKKALDSIKTLISSHKETAPADAKKTLTTSLNIIETSMQSQPQNSNKRTRTNTSGGAGSSSSGKRARTNP
ncbi:MAG: hypothetical protein ACON35_01440 [Candidatus Marinamargulisbacteria bacterium]